MQKVNVTELRNHLPDYLAKAGSGQTLVITSNGATMSELKPGRASLRVLPCPPPGRGAGKSSQLHNIQDLGTELV